MLQEQHIRGTRGLVPEALMSALHPETVLTPYKLGDLQLPNRIVMAPLTRNRAGEDGVPTALTAEYYAQRASAGLIISEASQISAEGQGYAGTPGIYSGAQIAGWELVTHAVHTCGGRIFLQLWHVGRISHTSLQPGGRSPVAPSAIRAKAQTFIDGGFAEVSEPRALEANEIGEIVAAYAAAAKNALWAGFDGVEVHAANGYLIDQFLCDGPNRRTDEYGGPIENRARFLTEVMKSVIDQVGKDCVGVRISPVSTVNDAHDSDPSGLFNYVVRELDRLKPVYLHVIEGQTGGPRDIDPEFDFAALRMKFHGTYMGNNGYSLALADKRTAEGAVDLVAFGRPFIANPDPVGRFRYLPAAAGYSNRAASDGKVGVELLQWQQGIARGWESVRFGKVTVETKDGQHLFQITVARGDLRQDQFRVEFYAGPNGDTGASPELLAACKSSAEASGSIVFSACCPARRAASDYTARIVPSHIGASVPLEAGQILWQR